MGRTTKVSSATNAGDDIRAEEAQIDRLLARLHRAVDQIEHGSSIQTAASTLARRYAEFTPTGDGGADLATLTEFEQHASSLLRKAQAQVRTGTNQGAVARVTPVSR